MAKKQTETKEKVIEEPIKLSTNAPANARWYVVHTYSGHENKVATNLKQRIETMKLEEKIFDIIVPTRNIVTVRHGKKEEQKEKIFPGYILVKMVLDDESWLAVRTTQGVTAFVGAGNKPTPISEAEVGSILKFMEQEAPKYKTSFSMGEAVKIVDGPFSDFLGTIDSIDEEKGKVKVLVSIFGRETPVELDFLQVAKL
jgi:transcription termination/antitermination protein NusG